MVFGFFSERQGPSQASPHLTCVALSLHSDPPKFPRSPEGSCCVPPLLGHAPLSLTRTCFFTGQKSWSFFAPSHAEGFHILFTAAQWSVPGPAIPSRTDAHTVCPQSLTTTVQLWTLSCTCHGRVGVSVGQNPRGGLAGPKVTSEVHAAVLPPCCPSTCPSRAQSWMQSTGTPVSRPAHHTNLPPSESGA